jgi:LysW-gamma-L-lysine carboxypeptidase
MNAPTDVATLFGLVSHYSPSRQEGGAVDWLVARMLTLGCSRAYRDPAGNAVGIWGTGPRQLVLLGHIDTVPGEIPVRIEDGVLHGRGAVDAKGPLAAFVDAAAQVGVRPGWQIVVIGAVEEEVTSAGARYVAGQYHPDFAIIGEPNRWDRVALGYKGAAWAEVTLRRAQAHTASGQTTASEAAVALWGAVTAAAAAFNRGKPRAFDQLLPTLTGLASGDDGLEQWARLRIGARLPLDLPPAAWFARLEALAAAADASAAVTPQGEGVPAWAVAKNTPLVRAFLGAIRAQGGTPAFVYKTGTADLNIVAPVWGCPALVYGPGDSALDHTPAERIDLAEWARAVAVLAAAVGAVVSS